MADDTRRVKVLETEFVAEQNLLKWYIVDLETQKTVKLAIPAEDFGIRKEFPPSVAIKFCQDMKGKEINLVSHYIEKLSMDEIRSADEQKLLDIHNSIDQFPIYEVLKSEGLIKDEN